MEQKIQNTDDKKRKEYYKVVSIDDLKEIIKEIEKSGDEENVKSGAATAVIRFYESEKHEGQLQFKKEVDRIKWLKEMKE